MVVHTIDFVLLAFRYFNGATVLAAAVTLCGLLKIYEGWSFNGASVLAVVVTRSWICSFGYTHASMGPRF